jgi:hypothetical protein
MVTTSYKLDSDRLAKRASRKDDGRTNFTLLLLNKNQQDEIYFLNIFE